MRGTYTFYDELKWNLKMMMMMFYVDDGYTTQLLTYMQHYEWEIFM